MSHAGSFSLPLETSLTPEEKQAQSYKSGQCNIGCINDVLLIHWHLLVFVLYIMKMSDSRKHFLC